MSPDRKVNLIDNTKTVQDFRRVIDQCTLGHVPAMVKSILQTGAWSDRYEMGRRIKFETFPAFITTSPAKGGCGFDPKHVEALLNKSEDAEALAMWRKAMTGKRGGDRQSEQAKSIHDNIMNARQGTSRAYTLDRLSRERPDLFERVKAGTLSANAAAIEAGWRKTPTPLERVLALLPKL
jgi:hypothetical protein